MTSLYITNRSIQVQGAGNNKVLTSSEPVSPFSPGGPLSPFFPGIPGSPVLPSGPLFPGGPGGPKKQGSELYNVGQK